MKLNRKNKKGFTIVELVIVIAVIGILSAILIPTFANLTTEAQKAARKQQASDAYTMYLVEATDNKYDNLYTKNSDEYVASNQLVKIEQKAQSQIALNLGSYWFTYKSESGWTESTAAPSEAHDLVCKPYTGSNPVAATAFFYQKTGENVYNQLVKGEDSVTVEQGNKQMSTFNGVLVYYFAA